MARHTIIESLMGIGGRRPEDTGGFGNTVAPAPELTRPPQPGRAPAAGPVRGPFVLLARLSGAQVHDALRGLEADDGCRRSLLVMELAIAAGGGFVVRRAEHDVAGLFESLEAAVLAASRMLRAPDAPAPGAASPVHVAIDEPSGFGRRELDECLEGLAGLSLLAWPGQIVVGPGAFAALPDPWRAVCRDRGVARIRGRNLPFQEILWQDPASPAATAAPADAPLPPLLRLCLRQGERTCFLGADQPVAKIGRATDGAIVVADGRCSREHAHIEWRNGYFVLRDQSLNGTFVAFRGRGPFLLKHDETVLFGAGRFFCGHDGSREPQSGIDFELLAD